MITEPQSKSTKLFFHTALETIHRSRRSAVMIFLFLAGIFAVFLPYPSVSSAPGSTTPTKPSIRSSEPTGEKRAPNAVEHSRPLASQPLPLQTGGTPFLVTFDDVPASTDVGSHYPHVVFSSPGSPIKTTNLNFATSPPNTVTPVNTGGSSDFEITFPQPVNSVVFTVNACDKIGPVALVDMYQGGVRKIANQTILGNGVFSPAVVDFSAFDNITKVVVHHVNDVLGLAYDNVSFKLPAATPTPTPTPVPTPTPPPAPTGFLVKPDVEAIDLQWNAVPGATSYLIKRNNTTADSAIGEAKSNSLQTVEFSATALNNFVVVQAPATSYHDDTASNPEVRYDYVVASMGQGGTGPDSNIQGAIPERKYACSGSAIPPLNGGNPKFVSGGGWSMNYQFSEDDGLVLTDVFLNGRKMAAKLSIPYYRLDSYTTGQSSTPRRGELKLNGSNPDGTMRSKLIFFQVPPFNSSNFDGLNFRIIYAIDKIPSTPGACLTITQNYNFYPIGSAMTRPSEWPGPCEPSESLQSCAKFRTKVYYKFTGKSNENVRSLNIVQRHFYDVQKNNGVFGGINRAGLFQDRDSRLNAAAHLDGFADRQNPVTFEIYSRAILDGMPGPQGPLDPAFPITKFNSSHFDNLHQTYMDKIKEPAFELVPAPIPAVPPFVPVPVPAWWVVLGPGCPECMHLHWRWGKFFKYEPFGSGYPLLFPKPAGGSNQSLDIVVNRFDSNEEDPVDYISTNDGFFNINRDDKPVFWYSATSKDKNEDTMFWHTGWIHPSDHGVSAVKTSLIGAASVSSPATQDGPLSIDLGDVFLVGESHIANFDLSTMPPLPAGYVALNGIGYRITTDAEATGPALIDFGAVSINTQTVFDNLRIFHAEPDPFDPSVPIWVDTTILAPNSPAPQFSSRILSSRSGDLGVFVIGKRESVVPPGTDRVNLNVTTSDSPDPVIAANDLTYTITVSNSGPQAAHSVAVRDDLASTVALVSATPSQGSACKANINSVFCNLGTLNVGSSATITIVVRARHTVPGQPYTVTNNVTVRATEIDSDESNNSVQSETTISPSPNAPPTVTLTSPATNLLLTSPATVQVSATATDSDGTISKVEIFDDGELLGLATPTGGNNYTFTASLPPCNPAAPPPQEDEEDAMPCGAHALIAIATDNAGRQAISDSAQVFVNGPATVQIVSPGNGTLLDAGTTLNFVANASRTGGSISKVEFWVNNINLGDGSLSGANQYSFSLPNVTAGSYTVVAVAIDGAGVPSRSAPVTVRVGAAPQVILTSPSEGTRFLPASTITVSAIATSSTDTVAKVDFYANGLLIGSDVGVGNDRFLMTWRQVPDGQYLVTAVATDSIGLTTTSQAINIGVNAAPATPGLVVWFDDAVPAGATTQGSGGDVDTNGEWYWVDANPGAFSGTKSHQSRNFKQATAPAIHSHYFQNATAKLHVDATDKLFTYVFLDANNMPRELMLEWKDAGGSEHRAYWGANNINLGVDSTSSRRFMGSLPQGGQWVRLEVPASAVGFSNNDLDGMKFLLDGGRATWDFSGKTAVNYNPPPATPNSDTNWVNGSLPPGAVADFPNDWQWVPCGVAVACHQSVLEGQQLHDQHRFKGATPQPVNSGDQLFTYVAIDPANKPDQLFLQWHDGTTWHGAYWGRNFREIPGRSLTGTESWRNMGGLPSPPAGSYVRLEIPASYVGLEGKSVSGMTFGFFKESGNALITWGRSGKTKAIGPVPVRLSALTPVYQFFHKDLGYYYETKEVHLHSDDREDGPLFYAYPNRAAGTVPMYRFANTTKREFFYSRCENGLVGCVSSVWAQAGIAFYIYKDNSEPGTIALHLYHDSALHYFFSKTVLPPLAGRTYDGISGYVHDTNPLVPVQPSFLTWQASTCQLSWLDNSSDETGFRIESSTSLNPSWTTVTTVGPNVTSKADCNVISSSWGSTNYRVIAINNIGDSLPSNTIFFTRVKKCRGCVWEEADTATGDPPAESDDPSVNISSPLEGATVGKNLVISANVFDIDGNGSIAKVEFFDGLKIGELTGPPPYNFIWNNIANGPHTLTVKVTDGSGMTATSAPVHITVSAEPSVALTNPAGDTVIPTPGNITLQATASDADGSVAKVEFFSGDVKLGEDTTSPYSFAWSSVQAGTYVVTARVTDNVGLTTTSGPATVKVNSAPTVTLTGPANGEVVQAPGTVLLVADVVDMDGTINKVDFYQGTTLLGTATTFPYFYNWTNAPYGNYSITAKATDNNGAETVSAPVNWIVNSAPSVSITSPVNSAMFAPSSNVSINASASDPDGTISKVDFYQGTNLIGTDSTSPFSISWNNVALGASMLTAQATDNRGAVTTSSAVTVTTSTFFDDFNDNSLNSAKWTLRDPVSPAVISEEAQQLRITLPPSTATYNGVGSNAAYDMRGGIAQVELVQSASQAGWVESSFLLEKDGQNYLLIGTGAGSIVFRSYVNGVNDQQVISYNPVGQRYWRIRHILETNSVSFETSADGALWTSQRTVTAGFAMSSIRFVLLAGAWGPYNASPGAAIYNDFQYIAKESGLIAHWKFDENTGATTADSSGNGHTGTLANGPAWTAGQTNAAVSFDGINDQVLNNGADITNNFTIAFWAQPTSTHEIDSESTAGFGGISGQRYMVWPLWNDNGHAGVGVSVGTNGVSVYEHAANYMPATLVYSGSLSGWTHVTVVYENKQPKLYINGNLVRTGLSSPMSFVHLNPAEIGGDVYGYYAGKLDEIKVFNRALSAAEVATLP